MKGKGASRDRRNRRKNAKQPLKTIVRLIFESEKTEIRYFDDFIKDLDRPPVELKKKVYGGKHPKDIVQDAYDEYERDWQSIDAIWLIIDDDGRRGIEDAINDARSKGFKLAFSNPCFELWYLLHFTDHQQYIKQKDAKKLLKKHIPHYRKNQSFYAEVSRGQKQAIARARDLQRMHRKNGNPKTYNPSTTVFELVEFFIKLSSGG